MKSYQIVDIREIFVPFSDKYNAIVTASWVVVGIDRVTILSLYQSGVYNETK